MMEKLYALYNISAPLSYAVSKHLCHGAIQMYLSYTLRVLHAAWICVITRYHRSGHTLPR